MAKMFRTYQRNYSASDTTSTIIDYAGDPTASIEETGWEAPTGYEFSEWNSSQDGSGTAYQVGETAYDETLYAIWVRIPVPYLVNDTDLTAIADAIRTKGGTSAPLVYPAGFVSAINDISTGGTMQDIVIRCNSSTFPNTVSSYTVVRAEVSDVAAKIQANEQISGVLFYTGYNSNEEEWRYVEYKLTNVHVYDDLSAMSVYFTSWAVSSPYYRNKVFSIDASGAISNVNG